VSRVLCTDSDYITPFSFTVWPLFSEFFMSVLYTRIISPEYAIFIKINTSLFGMLYENDPVCYVHVPCDMSVVSHFTGTEFLF